MEYKNYRIIVLFCFFLLIYSCKNIEKTDNVIYSEIIDSKFLEYQDTFKFKIDSVTSYTNNSVYFNKDKFQFSFTNLYDNSIVILDFQNEDVKKIKFKSIGPNEIFFNESTGHAALEENKFLFFEEFKLQLTIANFDGVIKNKIDLRKHKKQGEAFQSLIFSKDYNPVITNDKVYFSNVFKILNGTSFSKPVVLLNLNKFSFSNVGEFPLQYKENYFGSFYALTSFISFNNKTDQILVSYPKVSDIQIYNSKLDLVKTVKAPISSFNIIPYSEDENMYNKNINATEWKKIEDKTIRYQDRYHRIYYDDINNIYYRLGIEMPNKGELYIGPKKIIVQILNKNFNQIGITKLDANQYDFRSIFVNNGKFFIINTNKNLNDNYVHFDTFTIK